MAQPPVGVDEQSTRHTSTPKGRFVLRADAIRPYNYGGTARTMPVDSLEKILCRISIAIIRIFRYNKKDTRQVYAGGLWGVLRRLFVMI